MNAQPATDKQIAFIHQLQADWAFLADATPATVEETMAARDVRDLAKMQAVEELTAAGRTVPQLKAQGVEITDEVKAQYKAEMTALATEKAREIAEQRVAGTARRVAALTASTDDLTKEQASALIDALN